MIIDPTLPPDSSKRLGDSGEWDSPYSWPVRREFSRILHRPRPHVGIVYTERFLNSRPLTYFDDETKIIRARAGALLKQVHAPLPKPSKVLRPYETLDSYTSHQLIPYGVPQHVYHQSYICEPAHLTIGRGHLACIQFAGGKGYPRRKHLYSDENRNIRDEIKFRSYYNRPKNQDPNTLATGFAWRLLHLPPKENKPFKMYRHCPTLPLLDSSKPDKEKAVSEEVKEMPSYRRYQKTLTEPIEEVIPSVEKRKVINYSPEKNNKIPENVNKYNKNEERKQKQIFEEVPQQELKDHSSDLQINKQAKSTVSSTVTDQSKITDEKKTNKVDSTTSSKRALNKVKPLTSVDDDSPIEKTDTQTSPVQKEDPISDGIKKYIPKPEATQVTQVVTNVVEDKEPLPKEIIIPSAENILEETREESLPEKAEVLNVEVSTQESEKKEEKSVEQEQVATDSAVASSNETTGVVGEKESNPATEQLASPNISLDLPNEQVNKQTTEILENPPHSLEPVQESLVKQNIQVDKQEIDTDLPEEPKIIDDIVSPTPQTEENVQEIQDSLLEDCTKINDEQHIKLENSIQEEESNVIVEFNDTEGQNRSDETGVTISQIEDESGETIALVQDEVTEVSISERNETSETVYSREETVIHAVSSTTTQYSEALADSDKPESIKDMVNETDVTTDEENLENPME